MATATKEKLDEVLVENGMKLGAVAASAARVFGLVVSVEMREDSPGWLAVARLANAMFANGMNDNTPITFVAFAEMLRRAFARAEAPGKDLGPFEALKPQVRIAWEAVARHVGSIFNMERDQVKHLGAHEKEMAAFATRGFKNPPRL